MNLVCKQCNKNFIGSRYSGGKRLRKYCSTKCSQISQKGKKVVYTDEWRTNISNAMKNRRLSEQHKKRIGLSHRGKTHKLNQKNEKNPNWKGDSVGYQGLHKWIWSRLGKARYCSKNVAHKSSVYHWANISGEYKREVSDWRQLCPRCNKSDGIKIHSRFRKTFTK